jgi:hypothetical protein
MALTINYVPGYTFTPNELVTIAKLNLLGNPTINLEGAIGSVAIGPGAVLESNCAPGMLGADTTGLAIMANGYFAASAAARAKFAAGFFGTDATSAAIFADGFFAPYAPCVADSRNLAANNPSGTTVTVTADEVVLKDSNGAPFLATTVNVTANTASSGVNGIDTGSVSTNWYYLYVIYNGTTVSSLLSLSATAPTMPGGYTYKALVSAVYYNAGLRNFYQQQREIFIADTNIFVVASEPGITGWTQISGSDATNFATLVPPIAKQAWGNAGNINNNGGIAIGADANGLGASLAIAGTATGTTTLSYQLGGRWRVPMKLSQTIFYIMSNTNNGYRISLSGFSI